MFGVGIKVEEKVTVKHGSKGAGGDSSSGGFKVIIGKGRVNAERD